MKEATIVFLSAGVLCAFPPRPASRYIQKACKKKLIIKLGRRLHIDNCVSQSIDSFGKHDLLDSPQFFNNIHGHQHYQQRNTGVDDWISEGMICVSVFFIKNSLVSGDESLAGGLEVIRLVDDGLGCP